MLTRMIDLHVILSRFFLGSGMIKDSDMIFHAVVFMHWLMVYNSETIQILKPLISYKRWS